MKKIALLTVSLALLASSSAFAQEETRAEVRQQLIQAEHNGLDLVTDESYPDISPIFALRLTQEERGKAIDIVQKMMKMRMAHEAAMTQMKIDQEQAMMKMQMQYAQSMMEMRAQLMDLYRGH
jgi:hypothetical protein